MVDIDELRQTTASKSPPALLQYLLVDRFPQRCVITVSLRARSVVVLKMISGIDRAAPIVFCHAPYIDRESIEYRERIVRLLGLTNVCDSETDEVDVLPHDQDHYEVIRSGVSGGGTFESLLHLNKSLAGFDCWISAAYYRPYSSVATERLVPEGRILRVDPLSGWSQVQVHTWMAMYDLPHHPRFPVPTYHY